MLSQRAGRRDMAMMSCLYSLIDRRDGVADMVGAGPIGWITTVLLCVVCCPL